MRLFLVISFRFILVHKTLTTISTALDTEKSETIPRGTLKYSFCLPPEACGWLRGALRVVGRTTPSEQVRELPYLAAFGELFTNMFYVTSKRFSNCVFFFSTVSFVLLCFKLSVLIIIGRYERSPFLCRNDRCCCCCYCAAALLQITFETVNPLLLLPRVGARDALADYQIIWLAVCFVWGPYRSRLGFEFH